MAVHRGVLDLTGRLQVEAGSNADQAGLLRASGPERAGGGSCGGRDSGIPRIATP